MSCLLDNNLFYLTLENVVLFNFEHNVEPIEIGYVLNHTFIKANKVQLFEQLPCLNTLLSQLIWLSKSEPNNLRRHHYDTNCSTVLNALSATVLSEK